MTNNEHKKRLAERFKKAKTRFNQQSRIASENLKGFAKHKAKQFVKLKSKVGSLKIKKGAFRKLRKGNAFNEEGAKWIL